MFLLGFFGDKALAKLVFATLQRALSRWQVLNLGPLSFLQEKGPVAKL